MGLKNNTQKPSENELGKMSNLYSVFFSNLETGYWDGGIDIFFCSHWGTGWDVYFKCQKGKNTQELVVLIHSKPPTVNQLLPATSKRIWSPSSWVCFPSDLQWNCVLLWQPVSTAGLTYLMWNQLSCPIPQVSLMLFCFLDSWERFNIFDSSL